MELKGKQRRLLKSKANRMKPIFSVGKNGLSPVWLEEVNTAIEKRELMKINILQNADVTTEDVRNYIQENSDIMVIQVIGRSLLLFKEAGDPDNRDVSVEVTSI
ncbi:YhbY family RNA-binding protein [Lentilactobacillus kosonis]|uniref:RNA binding protein n=1 Tax=Lentilactobacillus kosonis TaxID=2810561 RepID=A0A401FKC6_9LACO|nr:YhbY family RNA-binding protein [Lentilactobacillus kosonis]GAY72845.1 RNA binding protein [Lentilactobacillus kosonis]